MRTSIAVLLLNLTWIISIHGDLLIYGPNTPVYSAESLGTVIKTRMKKYAFPSLSAKYSTNKAIHPKVLLIYDYWDFSTYGEQQCLDRAKKTIQYINSYYEKLSSDPIVEVVLSGVILITDRQIYPNPTTFSIDSIGFIRNNILTGKYIIMANAKSGDWAHYTIATTELQRFVEWLRNNEEQFEDLNYDIFLYSFPWYIGDDILPNTEKHLIMGLSQGEICTPFSGAIINNLIGDMHPAYPVEISYLLGVHNFRDRPDSDYFTSTYEFYDDLKDAWVNSTVALLSKKSKLNGFSCIKVDEPDYDD